MKDRVNSTCKWKIYILTFTAYLSLHAMRMAYSFAKPHIQTVFSLSNIFLGVLDGLVYASLALGFGLRFLITKKQVSLNSYLIFTIVSIIGFLSIPAVSLVCGNMAADR